MEPTDSDDEIENCKEIKLTYQPTRDYFDLLNDEQKRAFLGIKDFVLSIHDEKMSQVTYDRPEGRYLLLDGPGGTGKTFIIGKIIGIASKLPNFEIDILAPTHKATNVIRETLKGTCVSTIAKFVGFGIEYEKETGKEIQVYKGIKTRPNLLIIDECSMVSKEQVRLLKECKIPIIFVGDVCQINPINERCSEVFSFPFEKKYSLVKNERVSNEKIRDLVSYTRLEILKRKWPCKLNDESVISVDFNKQLLEDIAKKECIVLSYKNDTVNKYNEMIRRHLFAGPNDIMEKYYPLETMVTSKYFNVDGVKFYTSDKVTIQSVEKRNVKIKNPFCVCNGKFKKFVEGSHIDLPKDELIELKNKYMNIIDYVPMEGDEDSRIIKCDKCGCKASGSIFSEVEMYVLKVKKDDFQKATLYDPVDENQKKRLESILMKYKEICKNRQEKHFWKHYHQLRDESMCKLIYRYAMTIHKSQGSGFHTVYFDLGDVPTYNMEESLRLIYTAVSRTKEELYIRKK